LLRDIFPIFPALPDQERLMKYIQFGKAIEEVIAAATNESTRAQYMESTLNKACHMNLSTDLWDQCADASGKTLGVNRDNTTKHFDCPTWKQYGICVGGDWDSAALGGAWNGDRNMYIGTIAGDIPSKYLPQQLARFTLDLRKRYGPLGEAGVYSWLPWAVLFPAKSQYPGIGSGKVQPLVIGVLEDVATPFKWSQQMKLAFPNSHMMTWQGYHHGMPSFFEVFEKDPTGVDPCMKLIRNYVYTGILPRNGITCHETVQNVDSGSAVAAKIDFDKWGPGSAFDDFAADRFII